MKLLLMDKNPAITTCYLWKPYEKIGYVHIFSISTGDRLISSINSIIMMYHVVKSTKLEGPSVVFEEPPTASFLLQPGKNSAKQQFWEFASWMLVKTKHTTDLAMENGPRIEDVYVIVYIYIFPIEIGGYSSHLCNWGVAKLFAFNSF